MMSSTTSSSSIDRESCLLTVNYAWYHVVGCTVQMLLLATNGHPQFFREAHNFGLFAMVMDYGVMYLVRQTRTLKVVRDTGIEVGDVDDLSGMARFWFFWWFDYWGAVALMVMARHVMVLVNANNRNDVTPPRRVSLLVVVFHATMWWTAPVYSDTLLQHFDDRQLLLERVSNKTTYVVLLILFSCLLRVHQLVSLRHYMAVLLAGVSCGLVHHVALWYHGMRGYDSVGQLLLTLCTEWPALLCAEDYIRNSQTMQKYSKVLHNSMILLLIAMMVPHMPSDEQLAEYLITLIPGHMMQSVGTWFLRLKTCLTLPPSLQFLVNNKSSLDCGLSDNEIWLISTTSKSGAVLSAKLLLDMATLCGYCIASGQRDRAGIPGVVHAPSYRGGQLLHAADMVEEWPHYTRGKTYQCISMTRDPLSRLRSFYTYARSGGEHWVRYETNLMHVLRSNNNTLNESIQHFWQRAGRDYLSQSHASFRADLVERNCVEIRFEDLMRNFEQTLLQMLRVFGVSSPGVVEPLVERMLRHDRRHVQAELLAKDPHASSNKYSKEMLEQVERIMLQENGEIAAMIQEQRSEMMRWRQLQEEK